METIASVPGIVTNGSDWFGNEMGTERSKGHGLFSLSGHVARPGQYEAPLGITFRGCRTWPVGPRRAPAEVLDPGRVLHPDPHR